MRTTIIMDEALLDEVRRYAFEHKSTLGDFFAEGARRVLTQSKPKNKRKIELPSFGEGGLLPGVSLEDKDARDSQEANEWLSSQT